MGGFRKRHSEWGDHAELAHGDVGHGENGVLSVAVAHAVVGDDGDPRSLGYVAYLDEGRQASDPLDVGLEDVDDLVCGAGRR